MLQVESLAGRVDRRSPAVSDVLRAMLRPQSRLYWIGHVGGDVERVIAEANARSWHEGLNTHPSSCSSLLSS